MKEPVYFLRVSENEDDHRIAERLKTLLAEKGLLDFVDERDMVAIKTHFGEDACVGYVRPVAVRVIGELIKERKGAPFLTETSTLYKGERNNAVKHIALANKHGFGYENTRMPVIMADGLYGDEETEVQIPGRLNESVKIASLIAKTQAVVMVSHFTGHLATGFGAALKNMGMGCASRKGKVIQHSTMKPKIKTADCTMCETCMENCPEGAITMAQDSALIDEDKCVGCGQCLATCRFDAVAYNWGASYDNLQKNVVEYAWGVAKANEGKIIFINYLTRISKNCDCLGSYENIVPDIGILVSYDPVAIDAASLDLVEQRAGRTIPEIAHNVPYRLQIDYAREIGFGNPDYELVEV
jgi:uncharacterized Fe-S center protein